MDSKEMVKVAVAALEDKKAVDIKIINIAETSVIADYFIIASGTNRNQVQAMADESEERLGKTFGIAPRNVEGYLNGNWILLDFNDVVIHIFDEENRIFYDLERIWRDGKTVDISEL